MSMGILHSTLIPVADDRGYIKISDVKVGDMVFDEAGYPSEVTDIKSEKLISRSGYSQILFNHIHRPIYLTFRRKRMQKNS